MKNEDESPVQLVRPDADGRFVFVCEHASNRIPACYNNLGVSEAVRLSHAAWDIGALELGQMLSQRFDSPLIASTVSRLVYDCNRAPESATAIVVRSEDDDVPGNIELEDAQRTQRVASVYLPFANQLAAVLDKRSARHIETILVTVHSFTPFMHGQKREVEIGVLHDTDSRFVDEILNTTKQAEYKFERNQPYGPDDDVTHTLTKHAQPRQLRNVMLEVRNDLLLNSEAIAKISDLLFRTLTDALDAHKSESGSGKPITSIKGQV